MRKVLSLALCAFLLFALCACGGKNDTSSTDSIPAQSEFSSAVPYESKGDDSADPENKENTLGNGADVNAEELVSREGKQNGIDVSKWQGVIDWKKAASGGVDFAMIRIGYRGENGKIYKDDNADYNFQQAEKAGILLGAYFFSTAVNETEAKSEADWVISQLAGYPVSYPIAYDCEGYLSADSRMYGISSERRTAIALAFIKEIKAAGYDGMVYAALSGLKDGSEFSAETLENEGLIWIANYPAVPYPQTNSPAYSGRCDMWQYTNRGSVPGVEGDCDMSVSYFTRTAKKAKNAAKRPSDAEKPEKNSGIYTAVSDTVTAKELVNLREEASTKSRVVGQLKNGDTLPRTATGSNGWSKLKYKGSTVYAITSYLTTDISYKPPVVSEQQPASEFKDVNDKVTAKEETNLRAQPSTDSKIIATIKNGEFYTRTGISSRGWSRINYKGQTVYAVTSLLTDKVNANVSSEESEGDGLKTKFTAVNERVTAKEETNLRTAPSVTDSEIVVTIKKGEYYTRTGISDNGWSRLDYNGQTVYAVSSYLTTE